MVRPSLNESDIAHGKQPYSGGKAVSIQMVPILTLPVRNSTGANSGPESGALTSQEFGENRSIV